MTYFSPNCKSPILLGRFMLWRAQSTVPTPVTAVCAIADDLKMVKTLFVPKGNGNEHIRDLGDLLIAGSTWKNGGHHGICPLKIIVRPLSLPILLGRFMLWQAQSTVPTPVTASPRISLVFALFTSLLLVAPLKP